MEKPPALILAGGQSTRMGKDKAQVLLGDRTLLTHVVERLRSQVSEITVNTPDIGSYAEANFATVCDVTEHSKGPLSGILTALHHYENSGATHCLVTSVDCPFLPLNLTKSLLNLRTGKTDIIIAQSKSGLHPTCGLWPVELKTQLEDWLEQANKYAVMKFLDDIGYRVASFDNILVSGASIDPFFNINTPEELAMAEKYNELLHHHDINEKAGH